MGFHGFLAAMKRSIHRLMCSFSILKMLPCPPVVYLDDFCAITESRRRTEQPETEGDSCQEAGHVGRSTSQISQAFHANFSCMRYVWASLHFLYTETDAAKMPLILPSLSQTCNVLSPPSSLSADLHPHSQRAWPSMVTTLSLFYPLHILALPEVHRSAAGGEIFCKALHLLHSQVSLWISLPFRFRHFTVCYCWRSIFTTKTLSLSFCSFLSGIWEPCRNLK